MNNEINSYTWQESMYRILEKIYNYKAGGWIELPFLSELTLISQEEILIYTPEIVSKGHIKERDATYNGQTYKEFKITLEGIKFYESDQKYSMVSSQFDEQNPIKICTEKFVEDDDASLRAALEENPENLSDDSLNAANILNQLDDGFSPKIIVNHRKLWRPGKVLTISFWGTIHPTVKKKIISVAGEWLKYANLKFQFLDSGTGLIRISTQKGKGSWSYVGTDALLIDKSKPTMNYGWFEPDTDMAEYKRTVLHEFGHAIGAKHEHQSPKSNIPWNKPKVYEFYKKMGWSKEKVDRSIFKKYTGSQFNYTQYDKNSIMHYYIPNELTIGDYEVKSNSELSSLDKAFIKKMYP